MVKNKRCGKKVSRINVRKERQMHQEEISRNNEFMAKSGSQKNFTRVDSNYLLVP